jgi:ParB family chromosome partitioning protein
MALLELPATIQDQVEQGALAPSAAYEVGKLADPALQVQVAQAVVDQGLTRTEVAEVVKAVKAKRPAPATRPDPIVMDVGVAAVTIRWKKCCEVLTAVQVLKKALRLAQDQERERGDQAA